jgi:hypothetical protein
MTARHAEPPSAAKDTVIDVVNDFVYDSIVTKVAHSRDGVMDALDCESVAEVMVFPGYGDL